MRNALRIYLPIVGGLLLGVVIGGVILDTDPAISGWILGAGSGLMGGAFIAALVTNEPLVGGRGGGVRQATFPGEQLGQDARPKEDRPE